MKIPSGITGAKCEPILQLVEIINITQFDIVNAAHKFWGIIKHIADKIKIIDATSEKAKESIDKLKLYRQSLISEAVTGKIDLRDWKEIDSK